MRSGHGIRVAHFLVEGRLIGMMRPAVGEWGEDRTLDHFRAQKLVRTLMCGVEDSNSGRPG
jgi:hypothetical protein